MLFGENLGKPAHADATDPDKMDMYGFFKIDFIHYNSTCLFFFL